MTSTIGGWRISESAQPHSKCKLPRYFRSTSITEPPRCVSVRSRALR